MTKEEYRYIYNVVRPYVGKEIIGLFIIVISTLLSLLNPYIMKQIIDVGITNKDMTALINNVIFYAIIFAGTQVLSIIQSYLFTYIGERLLYDLRMNLYRKVSYKDIIFFNDKQTGEIMSRILNELPDVVNLFAGTLINVITQIATLVITFIIMMSLNKEITIASLLITPIIYIILRYYNPKFKNINTLLMKDYSKVNDSLQENISNIRLTKYMKIYKYTEVRFSRTLHKYIDRKYEYLYLSILSNIFLSTLYFLPTILIFLYGGHLVIEGLMTVGGVVALSSYISRLFSPIRSLTSINLDLQKSIAAFRRYKEIVENDCGTSKKISIKKLNKGIYMENLTFAYPDKETIFEELNLMFGIGDLVQIVGENGAGKSTLIDLMLGILSPNKGSVSYDNIDVRNIDNYSAKELIGIVPQNIYLFNDTIKNNIKVGRNIDDEKILMLAEELGFTDVTSDEEINIDTVIANNGGNLSGGQRQKVSILRALAGDPQVIILDEASTFLDDCSKKNLYSYIEKIKDNKIVILISHEEINYIKPTNTLFLGRLVDKYAIKME